MEPPAFKSSPSKVTIQFHNFQNICYFAWNIANGIMFQTFKYFPTKGQIISDPSLWSKKCIVGKEYFVRMEKFLTKGCFIDIGSVKPNWIVTKLLLLHMHPPHHETLKDISNLPDSLFLSWILQLQSLLLHLQRSDNLPDIRYNSDFHMLLQIVRP